MVVEVDGTLTNLSVPIHTDCNFRILTEKDPEVLDIIRHDVAHIIAEAANKKFPEIQVTTADLDNIEAKMPHIVKRNEKFVCEEMDRDAAIAMFKEMGEHYKAEIIEAIPAGKQISLTVMENLLIYVVDCIAHLLVK